MEAPLDSSALSAELRRPYAASSNVRAVLQRTRTRNLPDKIDDDFLQLADISPVVFGRVREALRFLGMIDKNGQRTAKLEAIAASTDEDYKTLLESAVRDAYSDDFERVNPSEDSQGKIVSAFRRYEPRSQTARMVMLFLGLCREAGITVLDAPRERSMKGPQTSARSAGGGSTGSRVQREDPRQDVLPPEGHALTPRHQPGVIFSVTEEDIAGLGEDEFQEVWAALGKVARARSRPKNPEPAVPVDDHEPESGEGDEEGLV